MKNEKSARVIVASNLIKTNQLTSWGIYTQKPLEGKDLVKQSWMICYQTMTTLM